MPRVTLASCGRCGKPRGLTHTCVTTRKGPAWRWKPAVAFTCPSCGKQVPNLLTHTCSPKSDFRRRKAAAARQEKTEARRRKRKATAARRRARKKERQREAAERRKRAEREKREAQRRAVRPKSHDRQKHDYETCTDSNCAAFPCRVYREGREAGHVDGLAEGYAKGFTDGVAECPLPHR